jgi:putative spermidine/putrescine transport system ATP-binding protein
LDLDIPAGSLLSFLGPSGCGKTTTLRLVAGLIDPTAGSIVVGGRDLTAVPASRRNIGVLFQNYALFPHLTVAENVGFGLRMRRMRGSEIRTAVAEALDLVQLPDFEDRMPEQLSGGQQQRVALARALAIHPALLLLDEPMSALDRSLREAVRTQLRALQRRLGITTIMVTHDQEEALTISDFVAVMNKGRIEQIGTPADIYMRPATRFVAGFIGTTNTTAAEIIGMTPGGAEVSVFGTRMGLEKPALVERQTHIPVTIRPEHVRFRPCADEIPAPGQVSATLLETSYRGADTVFTFVVPDGSTIVATRNNDGSGPPADEVGKPFILSFGQDLRVLHGTDPAGHKRAILQQGG